MGKIKILTSGVTFQTLKHSGKHPCSVCRTGVGSNTIYCTTCSHTGYTRNAVEYKSLLNGTLITIVPDAKVLLV